MTLLYRLSYTRVQLASREAWSGRQDSNL
jgi:hypothetical protein